MSVCSSFVIVEQLGFNNVAGFKMQCLEAFLYVFVFAFPKVLPALMNKQYWSDMLLNHFYTCQRWSEQYSAV